MSLLETLAGALPEIPSGALMSRPQRGKPYGRRYRWTRRALAHLAGVGVTAITKAAQRDPALWEALHTERGTWRRDITDADAREIAARVLDSVLLWDCARAKHPFAPKLGLDACVRCGLADSRHWAHGVCHRCAMREQRGSNIRRDLWAPVLHATCCRVCETTERKHFSAGLCSPCWLWVRRNGEDAKRVKARRKRLQRHGLRRGKSEKTYRKGRKK